MLTLPKLLALCAAGAAATAAIIGPPVAKLIQAMQHKQPAIESIRAIYTTRIDKLTQPEP